MGGGELGTFWDNPKARLMLSKKKFEVVKKKNKTLDEMGHVHFLLDKMGLDEMGLDEMALNHFLTFLSWSSSTSE